MPFVDNTRFTKAYYHVIVQVLPREPNGILACCNPLPPLVKQQLNEIHRLILDAKDVALVKAVTAATGSTAKSTVQKTYAIEAKYDSQKLLQCPIDSSHFDFEAGRGREDGETAMDVDVEKTTVSDVSSSQLPRLLTNEGAELKEKHQPDLPIGISTGDSDSQAHSE